MTSVYSTPFAQCTEGSAGRRHPSSEQAEASGVLHAFPFEGLGFWGLGFRVLAVSEWVGQIVRISELFGLQEFEGFRNLRVFRNLRDFRNFFLLL